MAFFEHLTKKVGEAAQAAAKKSNELLEVTRLNMNIGAEEDKIKELYIQMGKKVYGLYSSEGEPGDDFKADCEQISIHEQNIRELKQKILDVKNVRLCPSCSAEVDNSAVFCAKCGTRVED